MNNNLKNEIGDIHAEALNLLKNGNVIKPTRYLGG